MTVLTEDLMALLEKASDPTDQVVSRAKETMADLRKFVYALETATNKKGDCLSWLEFRLDEADSALDDLTDLIEEKSR